MLYSADPLDRAHHLRRDDKAMAELHASAAKLVLPFWRELSLIGPDSAAALLSGTQGAEILDLAAEVVFLGLFQGQPLFAADLSEVEAEEDGSPPRLGLPGDWQGLRQMAALLPAEHSCILATARALLLWHRRARFCGACGAPTESRDGGHSRACLDATCASQHFPRTDPAVLMLVADGERVLLHRQPAWPKGQWSILAGFVEAGETLEQAVRREVQEETGILVDEIAYAGSQPWPFPSSLMMGFTARPVGGELRPDPHELEDAQWFTKAEIVAGFSDAHRQSGEGLFLPTPGSLSRRMMEAWLGGK